MSENLRNPRNRIRNVRKILHNLHNKVRLLVHQFRSSNQVHTSKHICNFVFAKPVSKTFLTLQKFCSIKNHYEVDQRPPP